MVCRREGLPVHGLPRGEILSVRGEGPPGPLSGEGRGPCSERGGASKSMVCRGERSSQ